MSEDIVRRICDSAQLACLLEVSSPKPGNVNILSDYEETLYEHFLASAVAIRKSLEEMLKDFIYRNRISLGKYIYHAINDTQKIQSGGNTNLGIVLLIYPLSIASAESLLKNEDIGNSFRRVPEILSKTTYIDTIYLYKAVRRASPRIKREVGELDVFDDRSFKKIREKRINLLDIFKITKKDLIADELVNELKKAENGYAILKNAYKRFKKISLAIAYTYLRLLAENTDTLVANKFCEETAIMVSELCRSVVNSINNERKCEKILYYVKELDKFFKSMKINPGSMADITATSLFIFLLKERCVI